MVFARIRRYIKRRSRNSASIDPDEVLLDSKNLPGFDVDQFKGRIEMPISMSSILVYSGACAILLLALVARAWALQVDSGEEYAAKSENNRLKHEIIFSDRGAIFDRHGERLAWNALSPESDEFSLRSYTETPGFSQLLGYVKYPSKDKNGYYFRKDFEGVEGIEKAYNDLLRGEHGLKIIETNALDEIESESTIEPAVTGENLYLSIDARVQKKLYEAISGLAKRVGFRGGSGAIMDVSTGELVALVNYPEYDSNAMTRGDAELIKSYSTDERKPFLNRFVEGLYTPGSIVKPFVALAALAEDVIDPRKVIVSTGALLVPNPYDKTKHTRFSDWKAHGPVDMRKAIAVSSNVYFYEVGGGFEDQKGVGIARLERYFSMFGFGEPIRGSIFDGPAGTIPTPEWKEKHFPGDPWRVGDTYYTSIGQYGFQVTPLQELRALAAIANNGFLLEPTILKVGSSTPQVKKTEIPLSREDFKVVQEGMRLGAEIGTASGLNVPYVEIAAKTGTAELGVSKDFVNSWAVGFFPYGSPRYAFVITMDHGPRANTYGGVAAMRELLDWMNQNTPEYFK